MNISSHILMLTLEPGIFAFYIKAIKPKASDLDAYNRQVLAEHDRKMQNLKPVAAGEIQRRPSASLRTERGHQILLVEGKLT